MYECGLCWIMVKSICTLGYLTVDVVSLWVYHENGT